MLILFFEVTAPYGNGLDISENISVANLTVM